MKPCIIAACAAIVSFSGLVSGQVAADTMSTPALKTMVEGMENTEANIVAFDVEPGWKTDHHHHPGHVFVYVLEGNLLVEIDGKEPMSYSAGEAFYETPYVAMVGSNQSSTERAKFIVFQFGEAGKPLMVKE